MQGKCLFCLTAPTFKSKQWLFGRNQCGCHFWLLGFLKARLHRRFLSRSSMQFLSRWSCNFNIARVNQLRFQRDFSAIYRAITCDLQNTVTLSSSFATAQVHTFCFGLSFFHFVSFCFNLVLFCFNFVLFRFTTRQRPRTELEWLNWSDSNFHLQKERKHLVIWIRMIERFYKI